MFVRSRKMKRDTWVKAVFLLRKKTVFTQASLFILGRRTDVTVLMKSKLERYRWNGPLTLLCWRKTQKSLWKALWNKMQKVVFFPKEVQKVFPSVTPPWAEAVKVKFFHSIFTKVKCSYGVPVSKPVARKSSHFCC